MSPGRRIFHPRPFPIVRITLGIALVWALLWFVASLHFQRQFDTWRAAERAAGQEISFGESRTGGSPLSVTRQLRHLRWKNGKGASLRAAKVIASMRPWNWNSLTLSFTQGAELTLPLQGASNYLTLQSDNVDVHIALPFLTPRNHAGAGLNLSASAKKIVVKTGKPQPFGDTISSAEIALRVMGPPPDFANKDSVAAWNAASGVIEFDAFDLDWGALKMAMKGTLGLDSSLKPEGAFSGQIGDREAVVKALAEKNWIGKNDAELLNSVFNQLPKPSPLEKKSGTGETIPISLQSGGLFLGPVRVLTLPPLMWQ